MCCIRAFSFVVSRAEKKKIGRLGQICDWWGSMRPRSRNAETISGRVVVRRRERCGGGRRALGRRRPHAEDSDAIFSFSFGALSSWEQRRGSLNVLGAQRSGVSTNSARDARMFDDGLFPRFFLRTLPTSQRTDDDAFFSHSSTGYRSRSWRPQQKDEAHQAKV